MSTETSTDDGTDEEAGYLPGTVWTQADALRVGERVFVRHGDEDLWAQVTVIEPAEDPDQLCLHLTLELDGAAVGKCTHMSKNVTRYLRLLPYERPADAIPETSESGLAAANLIYRRDLNRGGTISVSLPAFVARQILGDRGWHEERKQDGSHAAWTAPNGERFWQTDEAVQTALTAECAASPPALAPRPTKVTAEASGA